MKHTRKRRVLRGKRRCYAPASMTYRGQAMKFVPQARRIVDPDLQWFAVRLNIKCERRAKLGLIRDGFDVFLPSLTWQITKHGRDTTLTRSLFPRYMFVGMPEGKSFTVTRMEVPDSDLLRLAHRLIDFVQPVEVTKTVTGFQAVRSADGVESILCIDGRPIAVPADVLQEIADRAADFRNETPSVGLSVGDMARVVEGPFASFLASVVGIDDETGLVKADVEIFGRKTPVEFEARALQAA